MKKPLLVFLDGGSVDLGDIDRTLLSKQGPLKIYSTSTPAQISKRAQEADILITNKCELNRSLLQKLKDVRLICVAATGTNNVDLKAAHELGIAVTNVAGYSTQTVVEHTLLFLLALSHRILFHERSSRDGSWSRSPHFSNLCFPYADLNGKTLGILGYGTIGKKVALLAKKIGMHVLIARLPGRNYPPNDKRLSLKEVLKSSDFVTLHCALTPSTHHLINFSSLKWMKKTACLLNLARGAVVEEEAIIKALEDDALQAYATDVLQQEPPPKNHPFFKKSLRDRVLITPHVAWASRESRQRLLDEIAKNIAAFKLGKKRNRVV